MRDGSERKSKHSNECHRQNREKRRRLMHQPDNEKRRRK
jgi:hypothetical protein